MSSKDLDLAIIGGGPAGSTLASLLIQKASWKVGIFEKENYPRFHIGESLLPASMPIFKESGVYERIASGKYIQKYGANFVDYRSPDEIYFGFSEGLNTEIPSAFEVPRAEFDKDLLEHAESLGVKVFQPETVRELEFKSDHVEIQTNKTTRTARFVVDASGRNSLIATKYEKRRPHPDLNNVAVFAHFSGVKRKPGHREGDITIGLLPHQAWAWVIPFKGELTSVGVVCNSRNYKGKDNLLKHMQESLNSSDILRDAMSQATRKTDLEIISNYSHKSEDLFGNRWLLIGDAAVFLDPIFSSGVHVAVSSAKLAVPLLMEALETDTSFTEITSTSTYVTELQKGVKRFHSLISMFYESNFVEGMKKTLERENMRKAFTSAVAGDVWNESNFLFQMDVL